MVYRKYLFLNKYARVECVIRFPFEKPGSYLKISSVIYMIDKGKMKCVRDLLKHGCPVSLEPFLGSS